MSLLTISLSVFACIFGGALLGILIKLPEDQLRADSKDVVRLGMGLVATTAALVLALLVASAKAFYDTQNTEVTASLLFEAVAQGLSALRKNGWVEGIEERFGFVKVSVADVRVEHQVKIADFMKWLERP